MLHGPCKYGPYCWCGLPTGLVCLQAGEVEWLVAKDPSMKPKLDQLKSDYPQVSHEAMQDLLAANEGDLMQTVKVQLYVIIWVYVTSSSPVCQAFSAAQQTSDGFVTYSAESLSMLC